MSSNKLELEDPLMGDSDRVSGRVALMDSIREEDPVGKTHLVTYLNNLRRCSEEVLAKGEVAADRSR